MSPTPDSASANLQPTFADLQRQLAEARAERDEAQRRLVERTAERDESEAQKAAMAEVLQVINSSPGDLAPVFDAMLENAIRLCEASHGNLYTFDGDALHTVAARGDARLVEWLRNLGGFRPTPDQPIGRLLAGEPFVHGADATEEKAYSSRPMFREFVDLGSIRSSLAVAMRKDHNVLGVITLYRQEVRPFTDKQIALLQNFAAQAVIAMENARLITETREALEQQTATAEVLQVINSSPGDLAPVFGAILDKGLHLCEAAFGTLWTFDGECFHAVVLRRVPAGFAEVLTQAPYRPEPGSGHELLLRGAHYVQIDDAAAEARSH